VRRGVAARAPNTVELVAWLVVGAVRGCR